MQLRRTNETEKTTPLMCCFRQKVTFSAYLGLRRWLVCTAWADLASFIRIWRSGPGARSYPEGQAQSAP